ncbi:TPA: hypothetical protein N0F65_006030 [Lagenidium giganteum]|uniref:Amino acid permease/ SLC12A domain-containing protein n=1 Tax=Lagenidium giganteum TaxID=4803 RepID=A0AAV2Z5C8_9STRA|nr:TPA: hypothetical protein N0F65_006030 [Lagenidium giganteum]
MPELPPSVAVPSRQPTKIDVWLLGITIVIGGQYSGWNMGLMFGLEGFTAGFAAVTVAYVCFTCSVAEINGALPFAGGSYGVARCTLGYYPGFLLGCCEALGYIAASATAVISFANLMVQMAPLIQGYDLVIYLAIYASVVLVLIHGGAVFWLTNRIIGLFSLGFLVLYSIGSLAFTSHSTLEEAFSTASGPSQPSSNSSEGVIQSLPYVAWFYAGIECVNLASSEVSAPKQLIPKAQVACIVTLFVIGMFVAIVTIALPFAGGPAALALELAPLNTGFQAMCATESTYVTAFSLPATYGIVFGTTWAAGRMIHSMADSRLLPSLLARTMSSRGTPHCAVFFCALVSFATAWNVRTNDNVTSDIFMLCLLASFMSYTGQCVGYVSLRVLYPAPSDSAFKSPFGVPGALLSMLIWLLGILSILAFQPRNGAIFGELCLTLAALSAFYVSYARKRQRLSIAERNVLMVAHVLKLNGRRRHTRRPPTTRVLRKQSPVIAGPLDAEKPTELGHNNASIEDDAAAFYPFRKQSSRVQPGQRSSTALTAAPSAITAAFVTMPSQSHHVDH